MMPAFVIAQIEVTDPEGYAEYAKGVPATIERYGGRYIARGGKIDRLEGEGPANRIAIVQFPSMEQARRWYDSAEYRPLRAIRQANSRGVITLTEGLPL